MSEKLHAAIAAGDEEAVRRLVESRPELAAARSEAGLSPLLQALYNGQPGLVDVLLAANPSLDVFDAAAVGRTRALEELLDPEPELARAWSPDGFTRAPLRGVLRPGRRSEAPARARRGRRRGRAEREHPRDAATQRRVGRALGNREAAARARRQPERGPGRRLHAAPLRRRERRPRQRRGAPCSGRRRLAGERRRQTPVQIAGDGVRDLLA